MSEHKPVSAEATKAHATALSDSDLDKVTGGDSKPKGGTSRANVTSKLL